MITVKQESILIKKLKSLTEIELIAVFEELAEHIYKYNMEEGVRQALDVHNYRGDIESLEGDLEDEREEKYEYKSKCERATEVLEDIENLDDDIQKQIDEAIKILS